MYATFHTSFNIGMVPVMVLAVAFGMVLSSSASAEPPARGSEPMVVENVDLNRYLGRWYEIARIPVWFQKDCACGTTAEYTLVKDGVVSVVNRCCTSDGEMKEARGRAWVVDKKTPAKLKVSFFSLFGFWLFGGHYWIIDLDPDYRYAVVGHPKRTLGWILSRTPQLSEEVLDGIAERLEANGYSFSQFKMSDQTECTCTPSEKQ
jgi:apolipoprotein D and lipocalin family protein